MLLAVRQRFIYSVNRQVAVLRNGTRMHLRDIPVMPDRRGPHACIANIEFLGSFVGALDKVVILGLYIHRLLPDSCPVSVMGRSVHQPPSVRKERLNASRAYRLHRRATLVLPVPDGTSGQVQSALDKARSVNLWQIWIL
jgi:hypothetical protein